MGRKVRSVLGSAVAVVVAVAAPAAVAHADAWDINSRWVSETVEENGLTGASCDFDGDGQATFYDVVPGQEISLRLMLRWLADTAHEERDVKLWHHLDGMEFEAEGADPDSFTVDARTVTTAYIIEVLVGDDWVETGWASQRGYGVFTGSDGERLYAGPWQAEATFDLDGIEYESLVGPCILNLQ